MKRSKEPFNGVTVKLPCTCGGENDRCYKCDGTGIMEKVVSWRDKHLYEPGGRLYPGPANTVLPRGFASDGRGDAYGIRENGRFGSGPDYDDSE